MFINNPVTYLSMTWGGVIIAKYRNKNQAGRIVQQSVKSTGQLNVVKVYPAKFLSVEVKANFRKFPNKLEPPKFRVPGLNFGGNIFKFHSFNPMLRRQRCSLVLPQLSISFLLQSLVSGLGLLALSNLGGGGLDDTDSDGLP